ncbi:MAG: glycosyltransferase family 9 protein [Bacteroidetes bacterium]|nr:glycosyltransferase family 9 protein [Bacteroidota bacterium]
MKLKTDCRHFRGDAPCKPHKLYGVHCDNCNYYDATDKNILIIKLGALGDVVRTTPLLHKIKKEFPKGVIWWLTNSPEILPDEVDRKLKFNLQNTTALKSIKFDVLYNLDKDIEACSLTVQIKSKLKKGFTLKNGKCSPIDKNSESKFYTGIFDDINKLNIKSYPQEIFEICGFKFSGEKYILPKFENKIEQKFKLPKNKKIVGFNTGCGDRWKSRLWPEKHWIETAKILIKKGYTVLLLGGEQEEEKNKRIAKKSGATYLGHFPLNNFISLLNECDLIITAVSMSLHLAIGLEKKIILFNNIFNKNEFELYALGEILEPNYNCTCYFSSDCEESCMKHLQVGRVVKSVKNILPLK